MTAVTGYTLQHAIKRAKTVIDFSKERFEKNLTHFESDPLKVDLTDEFNTFIAEELRLAGLKAVQARFNSQTFVPFQGRQISLHEAITLIGVYGKAETMWKKAAKANPNDAGYGVTRDARNKEHEYAKPSIDPTVAMKSAADMAMRVADLKAAINAGNMNTVGFEIPAGLID